MPDNQTVDLKVERLVLRSVLRSKRIDDELDVERRIGRDTIEASLHAEHLCRGDAEVTLEGRQQTDFHRQARSLEKRDAAMIVQRNVVDDKAVEQSHVNTPH